MSNITTSTTLLLLTVFIYISTSSTNAMRLVIQRVKKASVTVDEKIVSSINNGMVALVGLHHEDDESDLQYCAKRLLAVKLWENDNRAMWRQHVKQKEYDILCVR